MSSVRYPYDCKTNTFINLPRRDAQALKANLLRIHPKPIAPQNPADRARYDREMANYRTIFEEQMRQILYLEDLAFTIDWVKMDPIKKQEFVNRYNQLNPEAWEALQNKLRVFQK